ncbi:MAG: hypothetical protein LBJ00_00070 [Planctomycetaceae bacterium]|nr:hypothetical protein [Planctomycetaceae bacterium]
MELNTQAQQHETDMGEAYRPYQLRYSAMSIGFVHEFLIWKLSVDDEC